MRLNPFLKCRSGQTFFIKSQPTATLPTGIGQLNAAVPGVPVARFMLLSNGTAYSRTPRQVRSVVASFAGMHKERAVAGGAASV